jgi:acyl carrier protein
MELNEFIKNFAEQFDDTDESIFKAETSFRDIGEWSSLIALSIIAMVDEEYEVQLRGDEIRKSNTIEDIYNIVKNKL